MQDNFLITGATGFVGSCLTRFLVSKNKKVSIIVRNKKLNWRLNDIASKLSIYECDLLNESLLQVIERIKPSIIFHLATYGGFADETDAEKMIDVNIRGTRNLINAVKKNKFRLFINTGSSSEYGIKEKAMRESDLLKPINDYGVTKASSTMFCFKIAQIENLPIITLRLFSPFGYFEDKKRFIPSITLNAMNNKAINLSSPTNVRDFIFIEDVVNAYLKAISVNFKPGEIFNIGMGKQYSIQQVVNAILQITNSYSKIAWGTIKKQSRQIEPKIWKANITKAKRDLNWSPANNLQSGLVKTVEWFKQNKNFYEEK